MGAVGVEAQVDPLWAAASLMRRHRFTEAVARCDEVLERNQLDQVRPPAPPPPPRSEPCLAFRMKGRRGVAAPWVPSWRDRGDPSAGSRLTPETTPPDPKF